MDGDFAKQVSELISQYFGVMGKFINVQIMLSIFILLEFVKKVISILSNLFKFKVNIPNDCYPIISILLGFGLSFIKPLSVGILEGVFSGIALTILYGYFEKVLDKIGGSNGK